MRAYIRKPSRKDRTEKNMARVIKNNKQPWLRRWTSKAYLLVMLVLPSVNGSSVESKKKLMFHFDKIEVRGAIQVFVEPGKRNREIEYFANSEIIDSIESRVVGKKTLYLDANNTFDLSRRIPLDPHLLPSVFSRSKS